MKGYSDIPELHHNVLRRLTADMDAQMPKMMFSSMFSPVRIESDQATWEIELGSTGMSPFTVPGAPAPVVGIDGFRSGNAKVAYWSEKTFFDEVFLNNLRKVGTLEKDSAQNQLGRQLRKLIYRSQRRKEWMCAKAVVDGGFTYNAPGKAGTFYVNYGRPEANSVALDEGRKWGTGTQRNPVEDVMDAKLFMSDMYGIGNLTAVINTATLKLMMMDNKISDLLKKSNFGNGDLYSNPAAVIGTLLGVGTLQLNDDSFEVETFVMNVSGTTITVDDASQFEVGGRVQYRAASERYDSIIQKITAVDPVANTVTVDRAFTPAVTPGRDKLIMRKKYIDDNKFVLMADSFQGIRSEFYYAPFGLDGQYDMYTDTWEDTDPDGVYLRVQNKGMPIIYNPQTVFTLTVA